MNQTAHALKPSPPSARRRVLYDPPELVTETLLVVPLRRGDLSSLTEAARSSGRLRRNRNLHEMEDPVHRLFNAVEPGSYIRPHRHLYPPKSETILVVVGSLGLLVFDEAGRLAATERLAAPGEVFGADVPAGTWHTFVALERGTVFFETKAGPYLAPAGPDAASWAPAEGDPASAVLEKVWRALFDVETTLPVQTVSTAASEIQQSMASPATTSRRLQGGSV